MCSLSFLSLGSQSSFSLSHCPPGSNPSFAPPTSHPSFYLHLFQEAFPRPHIQARCSSLVFPALCTLYLIAFIILCYSWGFLVLSLSLTNPTRTEILFYFKINPQHLAQCLQVGSTQKNICWWVSWIINHLKLLSHHDWRGKYFVPCI